MSKVLKIAGEVVAIGALAVLTAGVGAGLAAGVSLGSAIGGSVIAFAGTVGLSLGTVAAIGAGLTLAGGLLAKKPQVSPAQIDRQKVSLQLDAPRKIVFGHTALATDLRYQEIWGASQEYLTQILLVASHWCEAIEQVWLNDTLGWSSGGGTDAAYTGYFFVSTRPITATGDAYAPGWSNRWGANAVFVGCATVLFTFRLTGTTSKASSPFSSSVPSRITIRGKAARLYDPRLDSTVGGTGSHLVTDQTTWAWSAGSLEIGRNPALCLLFHLLGWRITNPVGGAQKLAVGLGIPASRIDLGSFMTAANACDEQVLKVDGTYEPRYRCDGMFSEADDPGSVITALEACMNAKLRDSGGRFALQVFSNDLATPVLDFTDDDVLDDFVWDAGGALNESKNVVKGRYTDPSDNSLYQLVDYPAQSLTSLDEIDRIETFDLALVQSPGQAQRLAKQRLERYQYPGTFAASFKARAWAVKDGDVVRLTFSALGMSQKLFRVTKATVQVSGVVPLVLAEENAAIYAWDRAEAGAVTAAAPNTFNLLLQPIKLAIDDAATTSTWEGVGGAGKPEDNATVGATIGVNLKKPDGTLAQTLDVINPALVLAPDGRLLQTIAGVQTTLGTVTIEGVGAAADAARRRIEADLASLSAAVAQLGAGQSIVQNVFRDAGLFTDPTTGLAKLYAVESRADQLTKLSVTLNAALGTIGLKADVNYVNQAILTAQLPGQTADLSTIFTRLTSAEVSLNGLAATVVLKADATVVTGLQGTVGVVQQSIDAINAQITQLASQTTVGAFNVRLNTVESTLSALDAASISQAVTSARRAPVDSDAAGASNIIALLGGDIASRTALTGIAMARQDLRAQVDSATTALAVITSQLSVQIGSTTAGLATEQAARITGDQASATALANYQVAVAGNLAGINTSIGVVSDAQTATAASLASFTASTNTSLASVNQSLVAQSSVNSSVAGTITSLSTTVGGHTTTLATYGQSIDGISAKYGVEINANGVVTGFALNNASGRTDMIFAVDGFMIAQPNGTHARTVFNIAVDGTVQIPNVEVDTLKVNTAVVPAYAGATNNVQGTG